MSNSRSIRKMRRARVMLSGSQNHRCCYCGVVMTFDTHKLTSLTIEHVIQLQDGGSRYGKSNLVAACAKCNNRRQGMRALAYFAFLNPDYIRNDEDDLFFTNIGDKGDLIPNTPARERRASKHNSEVKTELFEDQNAECHHCKEGIDVAIMEALIGKKVDGETKLYLVHRHCYQFARLAFKAEKF